MSFILDALKKSEVDRQRQSVPGLMDTPLVARRSRWPAWAWLVAALLAVNAAGLAYLMWGASAQHSRPLLTSSAPPAAPAARPAEHFSPMDAAPVYAQEIPVTEAAPPSMSGAHTAAPKATAPKPHRADPVLIDQPEASDEVLPTLSELNLGGSQALPDIHLDVHVYATRPQDRFVYINNHKYHEGATLAEGPVLEKIRRDGAVLSYNGLRFLLPRQS